MRGVASASLMLVTFAASLAIEVSATEFRTWTDVSGRFRTEAQFLSLQGAHVQLKKPDGTVILVPLEKLSTADQDFARRQASPTDASVGKFPRAVTELPV